MQAAVQKYVDSSVSKTINAPKEQTVEETARAFELAYAAGLKGLAYYRDGSRHQQVLYHESPNEKIAELEKKIAELEAKLAFHQRSPLPPPVIGPGSPKLEMPVFALNFAGHPASCAGEPVFEEGCQKCYTCNWTAC
jgi:ribonucleotide reductase alpha subunit